MKNIILFTFLALAFSTTAFAQKKEMSVKDYFMAIPMEYLKASPVKRATWIEAESNADQHLTYNIPVAEFTGEDGEGTVYGNLQVFKKKAGGVLVGLSTNLCAEGKCQGMLLFLDYKAGKFTDVSEDYIMIPDNDEVIRILRKAPAFDDKRSLKDGVEVPLAIEFYGGDKVVNFIAGCKKDCDGGVVAKTFKWNGVAFTEFEYQESP